MRNFGATKQKAISNTLHKCNIVANVKKQKMIIKCATLVVDAHPPYVRLIFREALSTEGKKDHNLIVRELKIT